MNVNQLISYAQNFEDIMLYRALRHVSKGFYIDVGAWDPIEDSVTKLFYDIGWRGINVEPVKYWYGRLAAERERDLNLMIAISNKKGVMKFYEIIGTGLSTADEEIALKHKENGYEVKEYWVPCLTLNDICSTYKVEEIHFLKIDVEGKEKEVLEGLDLSKHRPWIIVVEIVDPITQKPVESAWDEYLFENGYIFVYYDGLNRFYLADEHTELKKYFEYPPCIFDGFVRWSEYKAKVENATLKQKISEFEMEKTETDNRIKALEEVANSLKFENATLKQKISEFEMEIQGFYSSVSWRITAPLRATYRTYLWVKDKLRNVPSKVQAKVSCLFLESLSKLVRWAIKHHSLVRLGKWFLSKNKRLEMFTLRLISGQVDQPYQVEQHIQSPNQADLTDLPESAKRIYFELIKALKVDEE